MLPYRRSCDPGKTPQVSPLVVALTFAVMRPKLAVLMNLSFLLMRAEQGKWRVG